MKAKVIIEHGETQIVLTPENEFEKDIIEKVHGKKEKYSLHTQFDVTYAYGNYSKHCIEMSIKEEKLNS